MDEITRKVTFTKEEAEEIADLICEELGDPIVGRNESLIESVYKKIKEAFSEEE